MHKVIDRKSTRSELVAEAQMDDIILDYYATEKDQQADQEDFPPKNINLETDSSHSSDDEKNNDSQEKEACVMFHGVTYLGSSNIDAPMSELELKRAISILRDHEDGCINIILSVSLNPKGTIRLIDPQTRTDIATYNINNICFWGKGEDESIEKDCLAFNISQGKEDITYHCHVFKCNEDDVSIFQCFFISYNISQ